MSLIDVNWRPDRKQLRSFGMIGLAAFGALAAWTWFRHSLMGLRFEVGTAQSVAAVLVALALVSGTLALTVPQALRPLYLGMTIVGLPIGFVVSHVILGVVYFGIFTPVALVFRLIGRDAMCRKLEPQARTYWTTRAQAQDAQRYFKPY